MEKIEYQEVIERMLDLVNRDEYEKAAREADLIDWRSENSLVVLNTVSSIYEEAARYKDARDILYITYKNKKASNSALFNICRLNILANYIDDAHKIYELFVKKAPNDPNRYLLDYMFKKSARESIESQIESLEKYKELEYTEKWAYELATLYSRAGMKEKCIRECDDIELWFSQGKYVKLAMVLKRRYKQLDPFQLEAIEKSKDEEDFSRTKESARIVIDSQLKESKDYKERRKERYLSHKSGYNHISNQINEYDYEDNLEYEDDDTIPDEYNYNSDNNSLLKDNTSQNITVNINKNDTEGFKNTLINLARGENTGKITLQATAELPYANKRNEIYSRIQSIGNTDDEYDEETQNYGYDDYYDSVEYEEKPKKGRFGKLLKNKKNELKGRDNLEDYHKDKEETLSSYYEEKSKIAESNKASVFDTINFQSEISKNMQLLEEEGLQIEEFDLKEFSPPEFTHIKRENTGDIKEISKDEIYTNTKESISKNETLNNETNKSSKVVNEYKNDNHLENNLDINNKEDSKNEEDNVIEQEKDTNNAINEIKEEYEAIIKNEEKEEPFIPEELFPEDDDVKEVFTEVDPDTVIPEKEEESQDGYIMKEVFDLDSQSYIGTQAGLTEDEKAFFSYFVPVRGMSEQIVKVLDTSEKSIKDGTSRIGNLVIYGNKGSGKTALAINVIKTLQKTRHQRKGKVAITDAGRFSNKDIHETIRRMKGGSLILENAGDLTKEAVDILNKEMEQNTAELFIILEDTKEKMQKVFEFNKEFEKKFNLNLEIPIFTNDELVTFGQAYAKEHGFEIDEMAILALYSRIDELQKDDYNVSVTDVAKIIDEAIGSSRKETVKKGLTTVFKRKEKKSEKRLNEADF